MGRRSSKLDGSSHAVAILAASFLFGLCSVDAGFTRKLTETSIYASPASNFSVQVSQITPKQSDSNPCALAISSLPINSVSVSPLVVQVQQGQITALNLNATASAFLNSTNTTATDGNLLSSGALVATYNPAIGLTNITFNGTNTQVGAQVTVLGGLYQAASGSNPVQVDPNNQNQLCAFNFTFAVVAQGSPSGSTTTSSSSTSSSTSSQTSSSVSASSNSNAFATATGTTTPLPFGIPVTTGNVDGSNRGFGNTGENNIGNGNKGNCNQGDGNIGDNNKGEGNRGSCNQGNGNVGNGWIGTGIVNTNQNGPNYPCSCTLNAVAGTTG